jgi:hypothetical protein
VIDHNHVQRNGFGLVEFQAELLLEGRKYTRFAAWRIGWKRWRGRYGSIGRGKLAKFAGKPESEIVNAGQASPVDHAGLWRSKVIWVFAL